MFVTLLSPLSTPLNPIVAPCHQVAPFERRDEADAKRMEFAVANSDHLTVLKAYQVGSLNLIKRVTSPVTIATHFYGLFFFLNTNFGHDVSSDFKWHQHPWFAVFIFSRTLLVGVLLLNRGVIVQQGWMNCKKNMGNHSQYAYCRENFLSVKTLEVCCHTGHY